MKWMTGITATIVLSLVLCTGPLITKAFCASYEEDAAEDISDENIQEDGLMPAEDAPPAGDYEYDPGEDAYPDDGTYQEPLDDDDQDRYGEDEQAYEQEDLPQDEDDQEWQDDGAVSPGYDGSDQIYMENPDGPVEEDLPAEEGQPLQ